MLQQEFEKLTGMKVSEKEYETINEMYMNSPFDKTIFGEDYAAHHDSRILWELHRQNALLREKLDFYRETEYATATVLIQKAHQYKDAELRKEAIILIGERRMVLQTLRLELPLWDEDQTYIENHLI